MANITIVKIRGLKEWNGWAKGTPKAVMDGVDKELKRAGYSVQGNAIQLAPVDTGRLRNSLNIEFNVNPALRQVFIFSSLYYAPYQEYGTSRNRAQPYLIPAFNREAITFMSNVRTALLKGLD